MSRWQFHVRVLTAIAAICLVLEAVALVFWFDLVDPVGLLLFLVPLALDLAIGICVVALIVLALRRKDWLVGALALGIAAVSLVVVVYGRDVGTHLRFARHRAGYAATIQHVEGALARDGDLTGVPGDLSVEPGPPLRVAFPWPGGLMDNWCGAVYDPSGEVVHAEREHVRQLFGGTLLSCSGLERNWYLCCFT